MVGTMVLMTAGRAATVTSTNDYPSTLEAGKAANHRVVFTTPSGVSEGETVTLTFSSGFSIGNVDEDDIDVTDDGAELTTSLNCLGSEQLTVRFAAQVLTITVCEGDGGEIAPASEVVIEIGTNATSSGTGVDQITNPSSSGTHFISIGGTFGDFGTIALPISSTDDTVGVSVAIPAISSGGSGGSGGNNDDTDDDNDVQQDTTAPSITNIVVSAVTETSVTISWSTSEAANSVVDFGVTLAFELGSSTNSDFVTAHAISLTGLSSGTSYYFRIKSTDPSGNMSTSATQTFSTLDQTGPIVSNLSVVDLTQSSARVTWTTNESASSIVQYGKNENYESQKSTTKLLTTHSVILTGLQKATSYHYRLRLEDAAGNPTVTTDQIFTTADDLAPANVSSLVVKAANKQLSLTWTNPTDADLAGVRVLECTDEFPLNPTDTNGCIQVLNALATSLVRNNLTNGNTYYYGVFAYDTSGQFASGAIGSGTPTASEEELPDDPTKPEEPAEEPKEEPSEGPAGDQPETPTEPSGQDTQPNIEPSKPTSLGAGEVSLEVDDLEFSVMGGTIVLSLGAKGSVDVLPNTQLRVAISEDAITDSVQSLTLTVGAETYLLRLADQQGGNALYVADVNTPAIPQLYVLQASAEYADGSKETVSSFLNVLPWGKTVQVIDAEEIGLPGVKVTLVQVTDGISTVWDGSPYSQFNPVITGLDGTLGWYVPNGSYQLLADEIAFLSYAGDIFVVSNHIVAPRLVMVALPPKPQTESPNITKAVKQATQTFTANVQQFLQSPISQSVQQAIATAREHPTVQEAVDLATPTIAVTAGASLVVMTVAFDFIPFLQYFFTAPILLFWRRKRKGFGVVYHAVSRVPVDLAIVRLYQVEDEHTPDPGRLIKSRVTDKEGRFFFLVQPGSYRLIVTKAGFQFPTNYLKDVKQDGSYLDLYHGEIIIVTDKDVVLTPNVPLDPTQAEQTLILSRVVWQARLRIIQQVIGISGLLISVAVAIIRPSVLAVGMIALQTLIYLLALRLAKPRKPKNWGIVYDNNTKRPLANVVARIFEPKYNKLLDTQITDAKGRYAFLLGPSEYFAVFEKPGYHNTQVRPIDLTQKDGTQNFAVDVELHPQERSATQSQDFKKTRDNGDV